MDAKQEISAQYRAYCDVCQSGQLNRLGEFWTLPASFTVDLGDGKTIHHIMQSYEELEQLYGMEFNAATGIDKTVIDEETIKFFGTNVATIETSLRHFAKDKLHDVQHAFYAAQRVNGKWTFNVHISTAKKAGNN